MPPKRNRSVEEEEHEKEQRKLRMRERRSNQQYRDQENEKRRIAYANKKRAREQMESDQHGSAATHRSDQSSNEVAIAHSSRRSDYEIQEERRARNRLSQNQLRSNLEHRENERQRDMIAHRNRRSDPVFREDERERDIIAHRTRRSDPAYREEERSRDLIGHRNLRSDPAYREDDQTRNTIARSNRRQDPLICRRENEAKSERRNNKTWQLLFTEFSRNAKLGPTHTCCSCDRLFFKRSITTTTKEKLQNSGCTEEFLKSAVLTRFYDQNEWELCSTCHTNLKSQKPPRFNIQLSGLAFPTLHPKIKELSPLERRIVAPRIPFMKIKPLGCDRQLGIHGGVINVPVNVNLMFTSIPIRPQDAGVIHVKLKRKMSYRSHYQYERIRPKLIYEAAQLLVQTHLYEEAGVTLDTTWNDNQADEIDFITDPNDSTPMEVEEDQDTIETDNGSPLDAETAPEQDLMFQETLIDTNHAVDIAPGEGQIPLPVLLDDHSEELSFPAIFAGQARNVNKAAKLSYSDIVNSEIRRTDRRAAEPEHLLYVHKRCQLEQIGNSINIQIKKAAQEGLNAGNALDGSYINDAIAKDNAFHILRNITGSPSYWEQQKKNVMAMVRQLGICTFFVTMSAAETQWKDLHRILMKTVKGVDDADVDSLTFEEKAELIRSDPVTCALYFEHRFKEVKKTWFKTKEGPFGPYKINHMYYRIEFQHRGSPHVHMLVWIENAPSFNPDRPENLDEVAAFIDSIVSIDSSNPDVQEFIQYQHHRCTRTCHKTLRGKTQCRFGAPFPPMRKTTILTPLEEEVSKEQKKEYKDIVQKINDLLDSNTVSDFDDFLDKIDCTEEDYIKIIRSQLKANKVFVKRHPKNCRINPFSEKILMTMQSNMDIQFILDPYACINYIVDYISKPSRGISKLLHNCIQSLNEGNHSVRHQLRCVGNCFYNGCEISAQECAWCRLRLSMSSCSVSVEFINTGMSKVSVKT